MKAIISRLRKLEQRCASKAEHRLVVIYQEPGSEGQPQLPEDIDENTKVIVIHLRVKPGGRAFSQ